MTKVQWFEPKYALLEPSTCLNADKVKFPNGMKALGEWIHDQEVPGKGKLMKFGLYTSRGTCQCSTQLYQGPGSHGYEAQDAQWMVDAGMDYLKGSHASSYLIVIRRELIVAFLVTSQRTPAVAARTTTLSVPLHRPFDVIFYPSSFFRPSRTTVRCGTP